MKPLVPFNMNTVIGKNMVFKTKLRKLLEKFLMLISYLPFITKVKIGKFETTADKRID